MITAVLLFLGVKTLANNAWLWWLTRRLDHSRCAPTTLREDLELVIILPVFEEQLLVEESVRYARRCSEGLGRIRICVVGTARERDGSGRNPTLELARVAAPGGNVEVIEYPYATGVMAHQVNYAAQLVLQRGVPESTWLFLVNIDSQFSRDGLMAVVEHINNEARIIQQSAVFLSNYSRLEPFERACAVWQSRWTLAHELKRLTLHKYCSYWLTHIVGHGLCISLRTFCDYGMLPEDTPTEDLHFGFYLAASGERIETVNVLELADSPSSTADVFKQKYVWAFGPLLYHRYLVRFRRKFPDKWRQSRGRALAITIQGVLSCTSWMISSWVILALLAVSLQSALAAGVLLLYLSEYLQCLIFFRRRGWIATRDVILSPLLLVAVALTHSLPANVALAHLVVGKTPRKYKTPHA